MPASLPILGSTGSTTLVLAVLLVTLGIAMLVAAVWLVRATRTDPRVLGPLEVMGDRRFTRRDPAARAVLLAAARPPGAPDPAPIVPIDDEERPLDAAPAEADVTAGEVVEQEEAEEEVAEPVAATPEIVDEEPASIASTEVEQQSGADADQDADQDADETGAEVVEAEVVDAAPEPAAEESEIVDAEVVESDAVEGVNGDHIEAAQRSR